MTYTDAISMRERSSSIAGVAVIHAGIAGLLVIGLATEAVIRDEDGPLITIDVREVPPKPTPPKPSEPKPRTPQTTTFVHDPIITVADPLPKQIEITDEFPPIGVIDTGAPLGGGLGTGIGTGTLPALPPKIEYFVPVNASPRGNPSGWIKDNDYRSIWIRREMTGTARFELGIGTNGRVTDCRITATSGHDELDIATCKLITKRARFNPAKDGDGAVSKGRYSSSIRWVLPK